MTKSCIPSVRTILCLSAVIAETGYSRSTLYLRIADGMYIKPVPLGGRLVGWPAREVDAINAARIAGKPDSEIRELVQALEKSRVEA